MNTSRLVEKFFRYVSCDSESGNEREFCELIEAELKALGLTVSRQEVGAQCNSNGWNVHAFLEGEGEPILFSAHMDTVPPGNGIVPVLDGGVIRSKGDTILGADDKGGIAPIMEALEMIKEQNLAHRPVEVLFSICEELGLLGAKYADYSQVKSKEAVVLDNGPMGEMINRSPAKATIHVKITGKSAHAAAAPDKGINAIKAAAAAIDKIPCGFVDECSVMNVANFLAPGKSNIVAEKASFDIDLRSFEADRLQAHLDAIEAAVKSGCDTLGASYEIFVDRQIVAPLFVPSDSALVRRLLQVSADLGIVCEFGRTFGASDAAWLFQNGIDVINVGTGMTDVHSTDEHISVADLEKTTGLVFGMMQ